MRRHQAVLVQGVGQQQVVGMAAVRRQVDHLVRMRHLAQLLDAVDLDALVDAVPDVAEQALHRAQGGGGIVGGDLLDAAARARLGLGHGHLLGLGLALHRPLHFRRVEHTLDHHRAAQQGRPQHRGAGAQEVEMQRARQLALGALGVGLTGFRQVVAIGQRHAEIGQHVAAVGEHDEELVPAPGLQAVGENQAEQRSLLPRVAAPENRQRHDLHIVVGGVRRHREQVGQLGGIGAPAQHECLQQRRQVQHRRARGAGQRPLGALRPRQALLAADAVQREQVDPAALRQHVAHRLQRIELERQRRRFRRHPVAHRGDERAQQRTRQAIGQGNGERQQRAHHRPAPPAARRGRRGGLVVSLMVFMAAFMAISRKEISLNVRALRGHASLAASPMTPRAGTACIIKIDATARSP